MYKILCTGNPAHPGIAKAIKQVFCEVTFVSRTYGYDLTTQESLESFKSIIPNYNVFINNSQIGVRVQEKILKLIHENCKEGHVFNIGSIAEFKKWEWFDPPYTEEKRSLRETSLSFDDKLFKTTHVTVAGFQDATPGNEWKMDPIEIANIIKWILEKNINIPIIAIEKKN
jgi:hypothetical protein